ncbi:cobalamin biosynthesis family protein [Vibrio sp. HN007]|uniref:cobalamin biosynthesis family protein n=1 Tax=Vibrio iocasae TaxID=3098914 RepID=UPI0035D40214
MQELFDLIYSNGALAVLWGALLFHLVLPIPLSSHPATLWRAFARILADKVNTNHSYSQSLISGSLAWLLMVIPAVIVLIALQPLVWQQQLFELALLLLAIDWRNNEKLANGLTDALTKEDKVKGRKLLEPLLNRDVSTLSPLGLGKAGAETVTLGFSRNVISVLFWYGLTGGIGAFTYRLIQELSRAWSPSRQAFLPFGLPAVRMLALLDYIPHRLFALMIAIGSKASTVFKLVIVQGKSWPTPGPGWVLAAIGGKLELSLGGPAIYSGKKTIRPKLGGRIAPSAIHLGQVKKLLAWKGLLWIVIQSLIMLAFYQGI